MQVQPEIVVVSDGETGWSPLAKLPHYDSGSTSLGQFDSPKSSPRADEEGVEGEVGGLCSEPGTCLEGWTQCTTAEGYPYYVNDVTGESVWTLPSEASQGSTDANAQDEVQLLWDAHGAPYYYYTATGYWCYSRSIDWSEEVDPQSGAPYFVNCVTGESTWYHPLASAHGPPAAWRGDVIDAASDGSTSDDGDTSGSDEESESEVEEVLEALEGIDGAVVGLTLKQRAAWTSKLVKRVGGSLVDNVSAAVTKLTNELVCRASPLLEKALPVLSAHMVCGPSLPVRAPALRRTLDADAAVYHAMHKSPRAVGVRGGGATAPRTRALPLRTSASPSLTATLPYTPIHAPPPTPPSS